ncbi:MAG: hypothetical protein SF069_08430 [Phycisphaerae bacterium]|nr:hypothetical protein [Phycisphaerae bacterium]
MNVDAIHDDVPIRVLRLRSGELPALTTRPGPLPGALQSAIESARSGDAWPIVVQVVDSSRGEIAPRDTLDRLYAVGMASRFAAEAAGVRIGIDAAGLLASVGLDSVLELIDRVNSPSFGWALRLSAKGDTEAATAIAIRRLDHRLVACLIEPDATAIAACLTDALRGAGYDGPMVKMGSADA